MNVGFLVGHLWTINHNIVIIDTAPSWNEISRNILMYVDFVIVPVVTDYLGYSGCDQIMSYIEDFKESKLGECKAEVLGIAVTRSQPRTKLARTITTGLKERCSASCINSKLLTFPIIMLARLQK